MSQAAAAAAALFLLVLCAPAPPTLTLACSPPLQHFTGLPPAPFTPGRKNVLLIGDSISMGGDPHSNPTTLAGSPGGYGGYVWKILDAHNIVSVQHNGGPYNGSESRRGDEQAGNTAHGLDCLDYWIGKNESHPQGLPWDVIHFNFGLHDLETQGPTGPYAVPPANYSANLQAIWSTLASTGAKLIWCTTTPVLFQSTPNPCKYCRNESSVVLYNRLALQALTAAAAQTPSTPLVVNDLWRDVTSYCGEGYRRCALQLSGGVHCTQEGRQYTGLAVAFSILRVAFGLGSPHPPVPVVTAAADAGSAMPGAMMMVAGDGHSGGGGHGADGAPAGVAGADRGWNATADCGAAPTALNSSHVNVLLVGDSISMGFGYARGAQPHCACGAGDCCAPDFRLGYGLYVQEMLANATAGWTLMSVQHNGGWYLDGQAGDTKRGVACIDQWLGGLDWDLVHMNFGLHDLNNRGKEVPVEDYSKNLIAIVRRVITLAKHQPPKIIFSTSTPVPLGDGGGSRTEANVQVYNDAAIKALSSYVAAGAVTINDLHGDIVAQCGSSYTKTGKCLLQVPQGVHYEYTGRQYCALSVTRKLLQVQFNLGDNSTRGIEP